jgi:hypothetical protein
MHRRTAGMRQQLSQSDRFAVCCWTRWQLPRREFRIHVRIQRELACLHQMQRRQSRHRFADGPGLKEGLCIHRHISINLAKAKSASPFDRAVMDDRDAEARDVKSRHHFRQRNAWVRIILHRYRLPNAGGDPLDMLSDHGRRGTRRRRTALQSKRGDRNIETPAKSRYP